MTGGGHPAAADFHLGDSSWTFGFVVFEDCEDTNRRESQKQSVRLENKILVYENGEALCGIILVL